MATNNSSLIVAMVPFPGYSHINTFFNVARIIASHNNNNVPIHFLCLPDINKNLKLRLQGRELGGLHFNDLLLPEEEEEHDTTTATGHNMPSIIELLTKLVEPLRRTCLELTTNAKKLVIIHDSIMIYHIKDLHSLIPNLESYMFFTGSAFSRYAILRQSFDDFIVDDIKLLQQIKDELPTFESWFPPISATLLRMENEWELGSGGFKHSCREVGMEGKYLDLLANNAKNKKPMWAIGPLHMLLESHNDSSNNSGRHECLEFLDKQDVNSVIFISFGTNPKLSQEQVNELALGLERSKHRFIWVLGKDENNKMDGVDKFGDEKYRKIVLPQGFEERVEDAGRGMVVRDWVPQLEILGHPSTGGFVTHCGWNSCLESISFGVPLVAWPIEYEQPYNAIFVTRVLKIGISVKSWTRKEELITSTAIEKAVKTLMGTQEGEEMRQRTVELSNNIKSSVRPGGVAAKEVESFISSIFG